jgi:hypothetical protein
MAAKTLHDLHTTQFAWRSRRLRYRHDAQGIGAAQQTALGTAEPFRASKIQEQCMKSAKIFAVAFAVSALFAGSALAQGMSTQSQTGAGMQRSPGTMQGSPSGAGNEELNAQSGAATERSGVTGKSGTKGTVGANTGAHKATGSGATAPGAKKY